MAFNPRSPDVFITEISTGGRAIQGVGTATGAFLGLAKKGPIGEATLVTSFEQYIDVFGSFEDFSFLTFAVWSFFLNGGRACWVTRTGHYSDTTSGTLDPAANIKATLTLNDRSAGAGTPTLRMDARNEGEWGNDITLDIQPATSSLQAYNRVLGSDGGSFSNNTTSAKTPALQYAFTEVSAAFSDITAALKTVGGGANQVMPSALGDSIYFASKEKTYTKLYFDLDVSGVGGAGQWQYWDGSAWASFTPTSDATSGFTAAPADNLLMEFSAPSNWRRKDVNGVTGFFIRFQITTAYSTPAEISRLTFGEDRPLGVFTPVSDASAELAGATDLDDALYIGANQKFGFIEFEMATAGDVTGQLTWEYFNGSNWVPLQGLTETATGTQHLHASGIMGFTVPSNWRKTEVNFESFFWLRARITTNYASDYPSAEHILPQSKFFNMTVTLNEESGNVQTEVFEDITMDSTSPDYIGTRIGTPQAPVSRFVTATDLLATTTAPNNRPSLQIGSQLSGGLYDISGITDADYIGTSAGQVGLFSFDPVDDINLLAVPGITTEPVQLAMVNYAEGRQDLFAIPDSTGSQQSVRPQDLIEFVRDEVAFNSTYGAIYDYWIVVAHPITGAETVIPYSGMIAGMTARTDFNRGVWKSPAGTEDGVLRGALRVVRNTSKGDRDALYDARINPIRDVAGVGVHVDGGKTLGPSNSDFNRIAVRRLFLFVEESIQEGLQFAKHEPNDDQLWRTIRGSVNAFLLALWKDRALFGQKPEDAFFVICDDSNNTPISRDRFIVNVRIGLAAVKPGEFINVTFEADKRAINEELASFGLR